MAGTAGATNGPSSEQKYPGERRSEWTSTSGSSDVGVTEKERKKKSQEEVSEGPCRNFLSYECILLFPSHVLVKKHKNKKVLRISMCMHD